MGNRNILESAHSRHVNILKVIIRSLPGFAAAAGNIGPAAATSFRMEDDEGQLPTVELQLVNICHYFLSFSVVNICHHIHQTGLRRMF